MTATTGNILRFSITNHTEYYDKLLYYTGGVYTPPLVEYYSIHSVKYANRSHNGGGCCERSEG